MATDHRKVAAEIASECARLSREAKECGLDTIAFMLDMARIEAEKVANGP